VAGVVPGDVVDIKFFQAGTAIEYEIVNTTVNLTFPIPSTVNVTELASVGLKLKCKWIKERSFVSEGCETLQGRFDTEILCNGVCGYLS
jgi:hypothetical protein